MIFFSHLDDYFLNRLLVFGLSLLELIHGLGVFLRVCVRLLSVHHSLKQLFSILVLELVLLVLIAESVAEGETVLEHLVIGLLQVHLSLH